MGIRRPSLLRQGQKLKLVNYLAQKGKEASNESLRERTVKWMKLTHCKVGIGSSREERELP